MKLKKEVGIAIKSKEISTSFKLAAQMFRNTEQYMHVTIMHQPIANC